MKLIKKKRLKRRRRTSKDNQIWLQLIQQEASTIKEANQRKLTRAEILEAREELHEAKRQIYLKQQVRQLLKKHRSSANHPPGKARPQPPPKPPPPVPPKARPQPAAKPPPAKAMPRPKQSAMP